MMRLALYAGLAVVVALLVLSWLRGAGKRAVRQRPSEPPDIMVFDPVCSTYLPKAKAVVRRIKGETIYFCGEACADRYETQHRTSGSV